VNVAHAIVPSVGVTLSDRGLWIYRVIGTDGEFNGNCTVTDVRWIFGDGRGSTGQENYRWADRKFAMMPFRGNVLP
jgi:hypothetical protein